MTGVIQNSLMQSSIILQADEDGNMMYDVTGREAETENGGSVSAVIHQNHRNAAGRLCLFVLTFVLISAASMRPVRADSLKNIMEAHKDEIITQCREYGIWPSAVVGMAGVESGFASVSALAGTYNNYWGLSRSSIINAIVPCGSVYGGFASFPTFSDGLHAFLIWFWQGNYPGVAGVLRNLHSTPEQMYSAVIASGYMTGTEGYYEGIIANARAVGADKWDKLAFPNGRKYIPYVEGMPDSRQVGFYDYPADRYNTHVVIERLASEAQTGSGDSIPFTRLSLEGETGDADAKKILCEKRVEETDPEEDAAVQEKKGLSRIMR